MGFFKSLFSVLGDWTQGLVCILQVFDNWDISQFLAVYFLKVCEPDWTLWQRRSGDRIQCVNIWVVVSSSFVKTSSAGSWSCIRLGGQGDSDLVTVVCICPRKENTVRSGLRIVVLHRRTFSERFLTKYPCWKGLVFSKKKKIKFNSSKSSILFLG